MTESERDEAGAPGQRQDASGGPPNPAACQGPGDLGKIHHDEGSDIWYECVYDSRRGTYTWAILPPADP